MKKITDFHELECRQLATSLCKQVYKLCEKADLAADDELACRWHVATLNISSKIAFAYGPEETERFKKWLPLALKYCGESLFWAMVARQKKIISKKTYEQIEKDIRKITKKIKSIVRYFEKYSHQEKYRRRIFFEELE